MPITTLRLGMLIFENFISPHDNFNSRDLSSTRIRLTLSTRCRDDAAVLLHNDVQGITVKGDAHYVRQTCDKHTCRTAGDCLLQGQKNGCGWWHKLNVNYLTAVHSFPWAAVFIAKLAARRAPTRFPAA